MSRYSEDSDSSNAFNDDRTREEWRNRDRDSRDRAPQGRPGDRQASRAKWRPVNWPPPFFGIDYSACLDWRDSVIMR